MAALRQCDIFRAHAAASYLDHSVPLVPPMALLLQPIGVYGITYDMNTHAIEDAPPNGWD